MGSPVRDNNVRFTGKWDNATVLTNSKNVIQSQYILAYQDIAETTVNTPECFHHYLTPVNPGVSSLYIQGIKYQII
jgi:hypothetical protein